MQMNPSATHKIDVLLVYVFCEDGLLHCIEFADLDDDDDEGDV